MTGAHPHQVCVETLVKSGIAHAGEGVPEGCFMVKDILSMVFQAAELNEKR